MKQLPPGEGARREGIRMPKNIVVFSDGTGNRRFEGRNTNVAKLYGFMEVVSDDQVAFYDSG
ncbi:MAG TPA: hypothetical protein DDZ83_07835, partial [Nitrospinae bacterium]|nr:hypothetical protein [Nitrospinota bacterium]